MVSSNIKRIIALLLNNKSPIMLPMVPFSTTPDIVLWSHRSSQNSFPPFDLRLWHWFLSLAAYQNCMARSVLGSTSRQHNYNSVGINLAWLLFVFESLRNPGGWLNLRIHTIPHTTCEAVALTHVKGAWNQWPTTVDSLSPIDQCV